MHPELPALEMEQREFETLAQGCLAWLDACTGSNVRELVLFPKTRNYALPPIVMGGDKCNPSIACNEHAASMEG